MKAPRARLALLGLSSLITALDFTIVYVALPDIGRELGFSPHGLQWVVSAYVIAFGGPLLLAGRLSDLLGRRRLFLAGMALFAGGSLLGGLADAPATLVGARIVQGLGAAALFPATLALVTTTFAEGRDRDRALGLWAAAGAAGLSVGALLGGVLTEAVGWTGVFFVNLPLTALGVAGALALLPRDRPQRAYGRDFDLAGALTGTAGVTLLVLAAAQGPAWGWTSAGVLFAVPAGLALLAAFAAVESGARRPLLPPRLLATAGLRPALGVIVLFGATLNAVPYVLTQHFQLVLGLGALEAGLGFLMPTAAITVGNLLGERLVARFGVPAVLIGGMSAGAAGAALLAPAVTPDATYAGVVPGLVLFGLGVGVTFPAMFAAAAAGVPERDAGVASGLASTALQVGTAAGLALLVAVATRDLAVDASPAAVADGLRGGLYVIALGAVPAIWAALALVTPPPGRGATGRAT